MRVKTKADVMRRAHEIPAPTSSEALASAWQEAREIELDYLIDLNRVLDNLRHFRELKFDTPGQVVNIISEILRLNNFKKTAEIVHHNLYRWRLTPLEVLEVNTMTEQNITLSSVRVVKKKEGME